MAVTLEGVFRIIDRASPAMRGMEKQALKTDAAIHKLGLSLDELGTNKQLKNLDSTTRNVRTLGVETDNASKRATGAAGEFEKMDSKVDRLGSTADRTAGKLRNLATLMKPVLWLGIGAAIGVVVQALGALSGGVIALIPRLTDLVGLAAPAAAGIVGIGVAAIATKLAMSDLTKAYGGNKAALKSLTPEGRAFLTQLKQMKPVLKELKESAQQGLFPGLEKSLNRVRSAAPQLNSILRRGGASVGNAAAQVTTHLTQPSALGDLDSLSAQGSQMIQRGTTTLLAFLDVLRNFAVAAEPFTDWMTKSIVLWAQQRAAVSAFNRDSGKTADFLDRTKTSVESLVKIGTLLWQNLRLIGQAARPLGDELYSSATKGLETWNKLHDTVGSRVGLTKEFLAMEPAIKGIVTLFDDLGAAIFRMGTSQGLPTTVNALDKLVPSLEKTLTFLANTFGPPLANALASIGNLATSLTGAAGPFTLMADLLAKTLNIITALTKAVPGLGNVFGTALDVFLIQRFLVKLGLLQKGWLGVAGAARTAAAAEAGATGAGLGGGGLLGRARGVSSPLVLGMRAGRSGADVIAGAEGAEMAGSATGLLGMGVKIGGGLAKAERVLTPLGIAGTVAGIGLQFAPVSQRVKSVGSDVALGAGIGAAAGSVIPILGTGIGAGLGAGAGAAFGLLHHQGDQLPGQVASDITNQTAALGMFPTQIGKLTAELAIYQSAQKRLQGDQSAGAQAELVSINQEITARKSVVGQLKQERDQRKQASQSMQAHNIATDLGTLFDQMTKRGVSRAGALAAVNKDANTMLPHLHGVAQKSLAEGLLKFNTQVSKNDPAAKSVLDAEKKWIGQHIAGILAITDPARVMKGTPAEAAAIQKQLKQRHFSEADAEQHQLSRTKLQDAEYRYLLAIGVDKDSAAALIAAKDGTATMPQPSLSDLKPAAQKKAVAAAAAGGAVVGQVATAITKFINAFKIGGEAGPPAHTARKIASSALQGASGRAHGGRISGVGLTDHVPIAPGAMAAPGELIVNRHQEAAADRAMGRKGALSGLVQNLPVAHSRFKAGNLPNAHGSKVKIPGLQGFAGGGRYDYPLGSRGKIIGTPYVGTHAKAFNIAGGSDNWESENAIDIGTPIGTPVLATAAGTIGSQIGSLGSGGRFAGLRLHLVTDGNEFYYAHLEKLDVGAGQKVKAGQTLGLSGSANGVSHLHIAELNGNPMGLTGAKVAAVQAAVAAGKAGNAAKLTARAGAGAAGGAAAAGSEALTALAFAGNPFAQGQEALRAQAAAAIMGFVATGGGGAVASASPSSKISGAGKAAKTAQTVSKAASQGAVVSGSPRAIGRSMMLKMGWPASEWPALDALWTGESHWDPTAKNPSSGAYGIPQSLPGDKMASSGGDWMTNPATQIRWGLGYIKGRYGSPSQTYQDWLARSPHWYADGGRIPYAGAFEKGGTFKTNGPTAFIAGDGHSPKETVTVTKGHGGSGHTLTISHLEVHVASGDMLVADVQAAIKKGLDDGWAEFERELAREAGR